MQLLGCGAGLAQGIDALESHSFVVLLLQILRLFFNDFVSLDLELGEDGPVVRKGHKVYARQYHLLDLGVLLPKNTVAPCRHPLFLTRIIAN